jgi:peptidoglycan/LPS O-acetylase OafA/YrhL
LLPRSIDLSVRTYKPHIDGLRAIAILSVVAAHTNIPGLSGGYVGVDIFFVISGYLIINQILADIHAGNFSIINFAGRRAVRILPAFFLVLLTCLVLVTTIFVIPEYRDFARSFLFSAVMLVNHYFLVHQGYFDSAAFTKPLLHLWSLAVEEQFYLLAPITLIGISALAGRLPEARSRTIWTTATLSLAIISFVACIAFTFGPEISNVSFYVMPTRGWQFILGGAAAALAGHLRRGPSWTATAIAASGAAAIAFALTQFDEDTLYPSYHAAVPTVGAMFLIAAGLASPDNIVARIMAFRPLVWIGLVSFSWYLWHWPLISFARTMRFGERDLRLELAAAGLALVLAILTYRAVERPFLSWRRRGVLNVRRAALAAPVVCLVIAGFGYGWALVVAPTMLPEVAGLSPIERRDAYPQTTRKGLLLGDSHAGAIAAPMQEFARRTGAELNIIMRAGCPPLLSTDVADHRGRPASFCDPFFKRITFEQNDFAIITARWNYYLDLPPSDPFYRKMRLSAQAGAADDQYGLLRHGLLSMLALSRQSPVERILVIAPLPEFPVQPPYCVMREIRMGVDSCTIPRSVVENRRKRTMDVLREVSEGDARLRLIDPIDVFCDKAACRPVRGNTLLFSDSNHLSPAGVQLLYRHFEAEFLWAFGTRDEH